MSRTLSLPLVLLMVLGTGCQLYRPSGWPEQRRAPASREIVATPGVMYGYAPLSWDLPDGRTVVIDVDELRVPPTSRTAEATFSVTYLDSPRHQLRCTSALAPPEDGWFRCSGTGADGQLIALRLGTEGSCELSVARQIQTYASPACWRGVADLPGGQLELDRGHFVRSGVVVGYVSWLDASSGPYFAADIVVDQRIRIYDVDRPPHEADADLVLMTVALHWFEHAVDQD